MKEIYYDQDLKIEACHFKGIVQPFPNHFHDDYVIGYIEEGHRTLSCQNREYELSPHDILIFNIGDNHECHQTSKEIFDYYSLHIPKEVMKEYVNDLTHQTYLPVFHPTVFQDDELLWYLQKIHQCLQKQSKEFEKDELLFFICSLFIKKYSQIPVQKIVGYENEINIVCQYIDKHYAMNITLHDLCQISHLSQSTLLRAFSHIKGITPYRYLQTVRINKAKELLKRKKRLSDVGLQVGFSDQSHFHRFFTMFTGVTPKMYRDMFKELK